MDGIRVRCGRGRPRTRPGEDAGDSAYDTRDVRAYLRRSIKPVYLSTSGIGVGRGMGDSTGSI
jgi:hypothetical protein